MKKLMVLVLAAVVAIPMLASVSEAQRSKMVEVNTVCGTNYNNCGLCHQDAGGGGPLNSDGDGYVASGASYFCPSGGGCKPTREKCTDGKDNDCDDLIDCADPNCSKNRACK